MEPFSPTRPRTALVPQKAVSQNHAQKFSISLSVLKQVSQKYLRPLQHVHLWVSESPSSRSSSPLQGLWYAAPSLHVAAQKPCAMLHWVMVSQVLEPREALVPAWDPASRSGLPSSVGSKSLVGPASPGPVSAPVHVGIRARGPECPNAKAQRARACTKLLSPIPRTPIPSA